MKNKSCYLLVAKINSDSDLSTVCVKVMEQFCNN